jgi:hypothetical protein
VESGFWKLETCFLVGNDPLVHHLFLIKAFSLQVYLAAILFGAKRSMFSVGSSACRRLLRLWRVGIGVQGDVGGF